VAFGLQRGQAETAGGGQVDRRLVRISDPNDKNPEGSQGSLELPDLVLDACRVPQASR
jgi:hypothetical protein